MKTSIIAAVSAMVLLGALCDHADARRRRPRRTPSKRIPARSSQPPASARALCSGTYASAITYVSPRERRREASARYTFCLRATAVYQCPYFDAKGRLRTRDKRVKRHGTAFAFRRSRKQTYLATNEHVSEWPLVTQSASSVDGVPAGCRRKRTTLTIVDNEGDRYARDDITLTTVVADAELDVAVLKGPVKVTDIPFRLGQSSALAVRDAVQVRGFPLGAFQATSVGKVINPRARDEEAGWDHTDLVMDARLSSGNSGSPVLAVNCKTGQFELVGIYHAAYREGQGLNVAVGIDDFRNLLVTLKARKKRGGKQRLTLAHRRWLHLELARKGAIPWLPFGGHAVRLRVRRARIYYDLFAKGFPLLGRRLAVFEDLPSPSYGRMGRVWLAGKSNKLHEVSLSSLPAEDQHRVLSLLAALRRRIALVLTYRRAQRAAKRSRLAYERGKQLKRRLDSGDSERQSQMRALVDLAGRSEKIARALARARRQRLLARKAARKAEQTASRPAMPRPASRPAVSRPATSKPTTSKPTTSKPTTSKPTTSKPATPKPTRPKPATSRSKTPAGAS